MSRHHFAKYQRDELIFAEGSEGLRDLIRDAA
jgi:hypothetical protein